MRVTIISRIFAPEVSAASGLLLSWANEFKSRGHDVTILTTRPPRGMDSSAVDQTAGLRITRSRVLRDKQQYVRGYLSYLSFDVPLIFRLLFGRRADLYVVEPPPTTVAVVRVVAAIQRTEYVVDAADLWSDAAVLATKNQLVLKTLRAVEKFALRGSACNFVVDQVYADRMREIGVDAPTKVIGFGADTDVFQFRPERRLDSPHFVYAGTYSEWHGAGVFVRAFARTLNRYPDAKLTFIGNGQEREHLKTLAEDLGVSDSVEVREAVPAIELVEILNSATASLSSLRPDGYHYAFTTKIYSSLAVGCPVIYAGGGPTRAFFARVKNKDSGRAVSYDPEAVADAMESVAKNPLSTESRRQLSEWAQENFSLTSVASVVVEKCEELTSR